MDKWNPRCDVELLDATKSLYDRGMAWAKSIYRPRIEENVAKHWDVLVEEWLVDTTLPLFIRLGAGKRGSIVHGRDGRMLVPTDNSPAQWIYAMAVDKKPIALADIHTFLTQEKIPVAFALTSGEEKNNAIYRGILGKLPHVGKYGWYLAHHDQIGKGLLKKRVDIATCDSTFLKTHFKKFMSPSNMFVISKNLGQTLGSNNEFLKGFGDGLRLKPIASFPTGETESPESTAGHVDFITIKGVSIRLQKNNDESIQDFIRYVLRIIFKNNLIHSSEIAFLSNKEYSKDAFNVYFPLIQENKTERYWNELFGNRYYVCSQWDKSKTELYMRKISSWLQRIKDLNT